MSPVPLEVFTDLAQGTVTSGGTTSPVAGTVETWTVTAVTAFPVALAGATRFHVADPVLNSEIIAVTVCPGGTGAGQSWTVTRGADGTVPVAHTAGFTVVQVTTAPVLTAMQYQPWQFLPEAYGAVGNGRIITDVVLASNTTLTSASAAFTTAVNTQKIMINGGAGATAAPLVTTMTYVSATQVTLGNAASVTGSGYQAVYGTDDTAAINSALSAAKTYALANSYFAEIVFGAKTYILSSGPTQATSPAQYNAQILIPYPDLAGATPKLVIGLTGAGDAGWAQYWESLTPNVSGTALVSMTTAPGSPSGTFGNQSVVGGPSAGGAFTGGYANTKVTVRGIEVVCGAYTNQYAYDFGYLAAMRVQQSSAHIFAPPGLGGGKSPLLEALPADGGFTTSIGAGIRVPVTGNNDDLTCDDFTVEGYRFGLYLFDHFTASRVCTVYTDVAILIDLSQGASNVSHGVFISLLSAEVYNGGIKTAAGSSSYIPLYVNFDAECTGVSFDISDPNNVFRGVVHWTDPADTRAPAITGAGNLKIINDKLGPGQWTGGMTPAVPGVPLTTVAQVNTAYRDATVYITSGGAAVSVITVAGVATGLVLGTSGTVAVRVPSGQSIALTYASTAPTWVWMLD